MSDKNKKTRPTPVGRVDAFRGIRARLGTAEKGRGFQFHYAGEEGREDDQLLGDVLQAIVGDITNMTGMEPGSYTMDPVAGEAGVFTGKEAMLWTADQPKGRFRVTSPADTDGNGAVFSIATDVAYNADGTPTNPLRVEKAIIARDGKILARESFEIQGLDKNARAALSKYDGVNCRLDIESEDGKSDSQLDSLMLRFQDRAEKTKSMVLASGIYTKSSNNASGVYLDAKPIERKAGVSPARLTIETADREDRDYDLATMDADQLKLFTVNLNKSELCQSIELDNSGLLPKITLADAAMEDRGFRHREAEIDADSLKMATLSETVRGQKEEEASIAVEGGKSAIALESSRNGELQSSVVVNAQALAAEQMIKAGEEGTLKYASVSMGADAENVTGFASAEVASGNASSNASVLLKADADAADLLVKGSEGVLDVIGSAGSIRAGVDALDAALRVTDGVWSTTIASSDDKKFSIMSGSNFFNITGNQLRNVLDTNGNVITGSGGEDLQAPQLVAHLSGELLVEKHVEILGSLLVKGEVTTQNSLQSEVEDRLQTWGAGNAMALPIGAIMTTKPDESNVAFAFDPLYGADGTFRIAKTTNDGDGTDLEIAAGYMDDEDNYVQAIVPGDNPEAHSDLMLRKLRSQDIHSYRDGEFGRDLVVRNKLDVEGATDLSDALNVDGGTVLRSSLDVTGATQIHNTVQIDDALNVDADIAGSDDLRIAKDIHAGKNIQLDDPASFIGFNGLARIQDAHTETRIADSQNEHLMFADAFGEKASLKAAIVQAAADGGSQQSTWRVPRRIPAHVWFNPYAAKGCQGPEGQETYPRLKIELLHESSDNQGRRAWINPSATPKSKYDDLTVMVNGVKENPMMGFSVDSAGYIAFEYDLHKDDIIFLNHQKIVFRSSDFKRHPDYKRPVLKKPTPGTFGGNFSAETLAELHVAAYTEELAELFQWLGDEFGESQADIDKAIESCAFSALSCVGDDEDSVNARPFTTIDYEGSTWRLMTIGGITRGIYIYPTEDYPWGLGNYASAAEFKRLQSEHYPADGADMDGDGVSDKTKADFDALSVEDIRAAAIKLRAELNHCPELDICEPLN